MSKQRVDSVHAVLQSVLGIVGIPPVLLMAIPDGVGVEYQGIMQAIGSAMSVGR